MERKEILLPAVDSPTIEKWVAEHLGERMTIAEPLQLTDHVLAAAGLINPDIIILSRFLPGDEPVALVLLGLREKHPSSRVILLVGELDNEGQELVEMAVSHGVFDLVIGKDPILEEELRKCILAPSDYAAISSLRRSIWGRRELVGMKGVEGKGQDGDGRFVGAKDGVNTGGGGWQGGGQLVYGFFKGMSFKGAWPVVFRSPGVLGRTSNIEGNAVGTRMELRDSSPGTKVGYAGPPEGTVRSQIGLGLSFKPEQFVRTELRAVPSRVIAVIGPKGGVGRTTVATNLAIAAGRLGQRTALADLCPDLAWAAGRRMGLRGITAGLPGLSDNDGKEPQEIAEMAHGVAVFSQGNGGMIWVSLDRTQVAGYIRRLERTYGVVVLDCPAPANEEATVASVGEATDVYMVVDSADPISLEAATDSIFALGLNKRGRLAIIDNRHGKRSLPSKELLAYFNEDRGLSVKLAGVIAANFAAHSKATQSGVPVAVSRIDGLVWEEIIRDLLGLPMEATSPRRLWSWRRKLANA